MNFFWGENLRQEFVSCKVKTIPSLQNKIKKKKLSQVNWQDKT